MTTKRCWILGLLCTALLGMFAADYPPVADWAATAWSWVRPDSGSLTKVVVIEESGKRSPVVAAVVLGKTSDELRAVGKFRLFDKDDLPEMVKPAVNKLLETNTPPFVLLFRGGSYTVKPLPSTDEAFAAMLKSQGGF